MAIRWKLKSPMIIIGERGFLANIFYVIQYRCYCISGFLFLLGGI